MNYWNVGTAYGRQIYVVADDYVAGGDTQSTGVPAGYSIGAVVLPDEWTCDQLAWTLNALYGNLEDWNEFAADAGARSFAFFGARAEEASNFCDALAYAWTQGKEESYEDVVASTPESETLEEFVAAVFSGPVMAGDRYAGELQNMVFAVPGESGTNGDLRTRLVDLVKEAVEQHHFD